MYVSNFLQTLSTVVRMHLSPFICRDIYCIRRYFSTFLSSENLKIIYMYTFSFDFLVGLFRVEFFYFHIDVIQMACQYFQIAALLDR